MCFPAWRWARALPVGAMAVLAGACATFAPPRPGVTDRARAAATYDASLRVSLRGSELRARTAVLVAFRRPDALRVEVPGVAGPRFVAVARGGRLEAIFPARRAVFRSAADASSFEALFGIRLEPQELMDLLVGVASPRLRSFAVGWGPELPRRLAVTLPDGAQLRVEVDDARAGAPLSERAFEPPSTVGFRDVDAGEARRLWSGR